VALNGNPELLFETVIGRTVVDPATMADGAYVGPSAGAKSMPTAGAA